MKRATLTTVLFLFLTLFTEAQVSYNMVGPVQYPTTFQNSPGQLGKKGKTLYLPLNQGGGDDTIYISKRKKVGKAFSVFVKVEGLTNDAYQPSINKKGNILVYVSRTSGGWAGNDLYIATRKGNKGPFTEVRKLDEVNDPNMGDVYPFLSADGLELFFFRDDKCYYSSREKTADKFNAAMPYDPVNNLLDTSNRTNVVSLWMSNNGKTLMVLDGKQVYRADRKKTKEKFDNFELYIAAETFEGFDFISGISFTDNLEEFYVLNHPDQGTRQLLWFRKSKY